MSSEDPTPKEGRTKTPSQETRELKQEVGGLKQKARWTQIGKGVAYAAMAAVATYGASRDSGEADASAPQGGGPPRGQGP